jgi:hypothetical protein
VSDMTVSDLLPSDVVEEFVQDYEWVHTILGIVGNVSFFVGSVFFLVESLKTAGVWLFIIGSFGMMIGSIGRVIVNRARRRDHDERHRRTTRKLEALTRRR